MAAPKILELLERFKKDRPESLIDWLEDNPDTPIELIAVLCAERIDQVSKRLQSLIETNNMWDGS